MAGLIARYGRLPAWAAFALSLALLWLGLWVIGLFEAGAEYAPADVDLRAQWREAPWLVSGVLLVVPVLQVLLFQTLTIEGLRRVTARGWPGWVASVLAYGPVLHWDSGTIVVVAATWVGAVFASTYLAQRAQEAMRASVMAAGLQVVFASSVLWLPA